MSEIIPQSPKCERCSNVSSRNIFMRGRTHLFCDFHYAEVKSDVEDTKHKITASKLRRLEREKILKKRPQELWSLDKKIETGMLCKVCGSYIVPGTATCPTCYLKKQKIMRK